MMGVYINMEMPKKKNGAVLVIYPDGKVHYENGMEYKAARVPPHGDLIDRAELWVEINKICDRRDAGIITDLACLQQILSAVRHAPTIITAEGISKTENTTEVGET